MIEINSSMIHVVVVLLTTDKMIDHQETIINKTGAVEILTTAEVGAIKHLTHPINTEEIREEAQTVERDRDRP